LEPASWLPEDFLSVADNRRLEGSKYSEGYAEQIVADLLEALAGYERAFTVLEGLSSDSTRDAMMCFESVAQSGRCFFRLAEQRLMKAHVDLGLVFQTCPSVVQLAEAEFREIIDLRDEASILASRRIQQLHLWPELVDSDRAASTPLTLHGHLNAVTREVTFTAYATSLLSSAFRKYSRWLEGRANSSRRDAFDKAVGTRNMGAALMSGGIARRLKAPLPHAHKYLLSSIEQLKALLPDAEAVSENRQAETIPAHLAIAHRQLGLWHYAKAELKEAYWQFRLVQELDREQYTLMRRILSQLEQQDAEQVSAAQAQAEKILGESNAEEANYPSTLFPSAN
jgi:hypothetical protein